MISSKDSWRGAYSIGITTPGKPGCPSKKMKKLCSPHPSVISKRETIILSTAVKTIIVCQLEKEEAPVYQQCVINYRRHR